MPIDPDAFLRLFDPTAIENGHAARLTGQRSVAHFVGSRHVDKRLHFVIQVLLGPVPMGQPSED